MGIIGDITESISKAFTYTPRRELYYDFLSDYGGLMDMQSDFDEIVGSYINQLLPLVSKGTPVIKKDFKEDKKELSRALKYHPTNSHTFREFVSQMFYCYLLFGEAYAYVSRKDKRRLDSGSFKCFEIIDPRDIINVYELTTTTPYYKINGSDELFDKTRILSIKSPTRGRHTKPKGIDSLTGTREKSTKLDKGFVGAINQISEPSFFVDITAYKANPLSKEGVEFMQKMQRIYKQFYTSGDGPLVSHDQMGIIKPLERKTQNSGTSSFIEQGRKELHKVIIGTLGLPGVINNDGLDPDFARYKEIIRYRILTFHDQLSEAMSLKVFSSKELSEGYEVFIESEELNPIRYEFAVEEISKLARNSVTTTNDNRSKIGLPPVKDDNADKVNTSADLLTIKKEADTGSESEKNKPKSD